MSESPFAHIAPICYSGPVAQEPLSYRYYDKNRQVFGQRMEDWLKLSVCYWHSFCWEGSDVFGQGTFDRTGYGGAPASSLEHAKNKANAAFDFLAKLDLPYFTFHDRDVAPEGSSWKETQRNFATMRDELAAHMERTGRKLLWGTANLFSHPRYMAGAATNPDPRVFACAATQVKDALEVTKALGGEAYVLWGGREGYETLLNTDLKQELDQLARFLEMVVEHKYKIGFQGPLLIEPKPKEPTAHQYDFDVANVWAFLQSRGLEKEFRVNIEANHAILAGHSFLHEVSYAIQAGIFGSLDINRGDPLLGWDTDQFANDPVELMLVLARIQQAGGLKYGGLNFDTKLRRQSVDPEDLFYGHIGGADSLAQALLAAERLLEAGELTGMVEARYAEWRSPLGQKILGKSSSLEELSRLVLAEDVAPEMKSGRQEFYERVVMKSV